MPEWVWILIALGFLYDKWVKIRVFDFARGFIHIEFKEEKESASFHEGQGSVKENEPAITCPSCQKVIPPTGATHTTGRFSDHFGKLW